MNVHQTMMKRIIKSIGEIYGFTKFSDAGKH